MQEDIDKIAQDVVNAWGKNFHAGNAASLNEEFNALVEMACRYQDAKRRADNYRRFNALSEREAADESTTRRAFAEAHAKWSEECVRKA